MKVEVKGFQAQGVLYEEETNKRSLMDASLRTILIYIIIVVGQPNLYRTSALL